MKIEESNKELLEEGLWYVVSPTSSSNHYYAYLDNDINLALNKLNIALQTGKIPHESVDNAVLFNLISDCGNNNGLNSSNIKPYSGPIVNNVLTPTHRDMRRETRYLIDSKVISDFKDMMDIQGYEGYYVHHLDGKEYNNSADNLMVIECPNSELRTIDNLHKFLHKINPPVSVSSFGNIFNVRFLVYDTRSGKVVPRILRVDII